MCTEDYRNTYLQKKIKSYFWGIEFFNFIIRKSTSTQTINKKLTNCFNIYYGISFMFLFKKLTKNTKYITYKLEDRTCSITPYLYTYYIIVVNFIKLHFLDYK